MPALLANPFIFCQVTTQTSDVLLKIFRYFLEVSPRAWPTLVHTCRRWRRIVFASQRALHLRLFCSHGTPVQKSLNRWPALPVVVQYGGLPALSPPTPEDEDNIMSALKYSDRVISISLTITTSLLKRLSTIEGVFSELQDLVLLSRDGVPLTMPRAFRWGQRLRRLHSTGIAVPALLQPLYSSSSTNLLDLQLHNAFFSWQFSPVILKNVLAEMTQLRSLSIHFSSTANYHFPLPPQGEHVVLPVLTSLNYRGSMAYLEGIDGMINAPSLEDIQITSDNPFLALPKYQKFVNWIETRRSHCGHIVSSEPTISISLMQPGAPTRLKSQALYNLLQIFSMAQIYDVSPSLFKEEAYPHISTTKSSARMDISLGRGLLEPLNKFTGKRLPHLDTKHSINVIYTLQPLETRRRHENVSPSLPKLYLRQPGPRHAALREAVVSFMISRRVSGHPIEVEYEQPCDINEKRESGTVYDRYKDRYLLTYF